MNNDYELDTFDDDDRREMFAEMLEMNAEMREMREIEAILEDAFGSATVEWIKPALGTLIVLKSGTYRPID
jgi:thiamine pyrophosphate-dependent acetolactate synthase large subunit-like protein